MTKELSPIVQSRKDALLQYSYYLRDQVIALDAFTEISEETGIEEITHTGDAWEAMMHDMIEVYETQKTFLVAVMVHGNNHITNYDEVLLAVAKLPKFSA